jgi:phage baseplate assembly protein W
MGANRDWARVSGDEAILQKLILYFGIPKGELLNDPNIGCCLHNYIFDKLTDGTLFMLQNEMEYELKQQIPELGVHRVEAEASGTHDSVKLTIVGYQTWLLTVGRDDLLDLNLLDVFGGIS